MVDLQALISHRWPSKTIGDIPGNIVLLTDFPDCASVRIEDWGDEDIALGEWDGGNNSDEGGEEQEKGVHERSRHHREKQTQAICALWLHGATCGRGSDGAVPTVRAPKKEWPPKRHKVIRPEAAAPYRARALADVTI